MPERWRHLYRMHYAGLSRQVHAVYEPATRLIAFFGRGHDIWSGDSRVTPVHTSVTEQGTAVEDSSEELNVRVEERGLRNVVYSLGTTGVTQEATDGTQLSDARKWDARRREND
jgi:hypothetical protein